MDIVDRLFGLVDEKYKEQKDFAADLKVDPAHVSKWRKRKSASYRKYLPQIAAALGTTTEYLLTGEGPKRSNRGKQWMHVIHPATQETAPADAEPAKAVSDSDTVSEDAIKAAFFEGGEDLSPEEMDELWEDAKDYIQYKLEQRRRKKK